MVLLPEEKGMTLAELRQIAARQQHQIEAQQQLLVAKEQRLKFLKQQEARHHALSEQQLESDCLVSLRDKVEAQELKLRQLRALRGQVEQQKTNNGNLGTELDSIRALFCEKEKELDLAVSKVEELTRQLDEVRKSCRKNYLISSTSSELENLRRELIYCTKLSEQHNNYICQQREKIANRQQDISILDKKINELNKRLHRKRLLNEQFASQIHVASLSRNSNCSTLNSGILLKSESRSQEVLEPEHAQDDLAANLHGHHMCEFGEFSLTKNDPKYQTLPYNTKFTLKEKQLEDSLSSSTEDESWSSPSENVTIDKRNVKSFSNMYNFSPRPFNNSCNSTCGVQKVMMQISNNDTSQLSLDAELVSNEDGILQNSVYEQNMCNDSTNNNSSINSESTNKSVVNPDPPPASNQKPSKPAVPPKPALCVKPMLAGRENPSKRKDSLGPDTVSMALTFLKNKSSEKERSDFRHSNVRDSSQDPLLPKSRILTYFSKTLLQADDQSDKVDHPEILKRKSIGQLPIKPKPLTIRKNPGIEPPKLKIQPAVSLLTHRKSVESQSVPFSTEIENKSTDILSQNISNAECVMPDATISKEDNHNEVEVPAVSETKEGFDFTEEKCAEKSDTPSDEIYVEDQSDIAEEHQRCSTILHKNKKGNLKCEGSIRGSRRVSFDPLALLLDAALEGELELVKKTANEVVNPSAANDEGITALHNAICAGHFDVVKFLIEFGCDVNAQDSDGWTPLHCAASCNNLAMVKFLVERGACIFATTLSDQDTAAEKCEEDEEGFDGCSEYLFNLQENLGVISNGTVYAVYDYDGQNADELSFRNGDMLTVLRKSDDEENEWWWARLHDEEGYIPRNLLGLYPRVTTQKTGKPS